MGDDAYEAAGKVMDGVRKIIAPPLTIEDAIEMLEALVEQAEMEIEGLRASQ